MSPHEKISVRKMQALTYRAKVLSALRKCFDTGGFTEVETPVGIYAPASEEYIEAPKAGDFYLRTSPEFQMKRLVCAGMDRIYQIGPCFRAGESGRLHRPEFSMLEFYMAHTDYIGLLEFLQKAIQDTAQAVNGTKKIRFRRIEIDLAANWERIPVRTAFHEFAHEDADKAAEEESRFELILTEKVEPALPKDRPCVLIDYPVRFGAFARAKEADPSLAERWELYIGGVEVANTYGELIDPAVQRARMKTFAATRERNGLEVYPEPEAFLEALDGGMPPSAGSALGFDRLVMLLYGAEDINEAAFPLDS